MKRIIFLLLVLQSLFLYGQEHEEYNLWISETSWSKEIFHFPIHFAKEIPLKGYEDARFPKGWGDQNSPEFWSYVFAWNIEHKTLLSTDELETYLQYYFDGLMNVVNKDPSISIPSTTVLIIEGNGSEKTNSYLGKIRVYDAFRTKRPIVLHVLIDQYYCNASENSIVTFRFSPKGFEDVIWNKLKSLKLDPNNCSS